jgi:hypothetical protein
VSARNDDQPAGQAGVEIVSNPPTRSSPDPPSDR